MAKVASAIVVVRASSRVASPGGRPAPATDVKYRKMAVVTVVAGGIRSRTSPGQLGAVQPELRQRFFRAIHSRIRVDDGIAIIRGRRDLLAGTERGAPSTHLEAMACSHPPTTAPVDRQYDSAQRGALRQIGARHSLEHRFPARQSRWASMQIVHTDPALACCLIPALVREPRSYGISGSRRSGAQASSEAMPVLKIASMNAENMSAESSQPHHRSGTATAASAACAPSDWARPANTYRRCADMDSHPQRVFDAAPLKALIAWNSSRAMTMRVFRRSLRRWRRRYRTRGGRCHGRPDARELHRHAHGAR